MQSASGRIPIWVYEIDNNIDRAWFVENVEVISEDEIWQNLIDESFDPTQTAYIIDDHPNLTFGSGEVIFANYLPNHISLDVETDQGGFLVVSEVHYPLRWKSYIDGEEVPTYETNCIVRGLWIDEGTHKIEFKYDRSVFNRGRTVSIISTILALSLITVGFIRTKK
jgi:hypothetical protein